MKKLVVITGAASGFGLELAKLFAKNEYPMLLVSLEESMPEGISFPNSIYRSVNVTDYSMLENAIKEAEAIYGETDLIINNAGIMLLGDISTQNPAEWQKMMDVNVVSVLNGMQIVLSKMKERQSGTIINISSIAGIKTFGSHAAYCATKYGVRALSETVREEVSPYNVRVMVISPGAAETNLLTHTTDNTIISNYESWVNDAMDGVRLDPAKVAESALFMYEMPQEITVREVVIASTKQNA